MSKDVNPNSDSDSSEDSEEALMYASPQVLYLAHFFCIGDVFINHTEFPRVLPREGLWRKWRGRRTVQGRRKWIAGAHCFSWGEMPQNDLGQQWRMWRLLQRWMQSQFWTKRCSTHGNVPGGDDTLMRNLRYVVCVSWFGEAKIKKNYSKKTGNGNLTSKGERG